AAGMIVAVHFRKTLSRCADRLWGSRRRMLVTFAGAAVVLLVGASLFGYHYVTHGGMSARRTPPALERVIAWRMVDLGIPASARTTANPLGSTASNADLTAGRSLFRANCEACHASDGAARTAV